MSTPRNSRAWGTFPTRSTAEEVPDQASGCLTSGPPGNPPLRRRHGVPYPGTRRLGPENVTRSVRSWRSWSGPTPDGTRPPWASFFSTPGFKGVLTGFEIHGVGGTARRSVEISQRRRASPSPHPCFPASPTVSGIRPASSVTMFPCFPSGTGSYVPVGSGLPSLVPPISVPSSPTEQALIRFRDWLSTPRTWNKDRPRNHAPRGNQGRSFHGDHRTVRHDGRGEFDHESFEPRLQYGLIGNTGAPELYAPRRHPASSWSPRPCGQLLAYAELIPGRDPAATRRCCLWEWDSAPPHPPPFLTLRLGAPPPSLRRRTRPPFRLVGGNRSLVIRPKTDPTNLVIRVDAASGALRSLNGKDSTEPTCLRSGVS